MSEESPIHDDPRDRTRPGDAIELGREAWVAPGDARWNFTRSGGPGGQHVNKTATRSELRVFLAAIGGVHPEAVERIRSNAGHMLVESSDEIRIVSQEHRSQMQNKEACIARLKALVAACEVRPKVRRKTKPTRASKERRLKDKREHSEKKRNRQKPEGD